MTPSPATPLPCPFCGGKVTFNETPHPDREGSKTPHLYIPEVGTRLACGSCLNGFYASGGSREGRESILLSRWNTRPVPIQDAGVEALMPIVQCAELLALSSTQKDKEAFLERLRGLFKQAKLGVSLEGK